MNPEKIARQQLINLLKGGQTYALLEQVLEGIPFKHLGKIPKGLPYSIWQLANHILFAQRDILEFIREPDYKEPKWPDEYWPAQNPGPRSVKEWNETIKSILRDRKKISILVKESNDIFSPLPNGNGQTLMREAMIVAEHNAYHAGEIVLIRRLLGIWPY